MALSIVTVTMIVGLMVGNMVPVTYPITQY